MKYRVISDTHFNHEKLTTHMKSRPENFSELIERNWNQAMGPGDVMIHLGDFLVGSKSQAKNILARLKGKKWLIRGNHDRDKPCAWWVDQGFDMCVDSFVLRDILFTHEPANAIIKSNGNRPYEMLDEGLPFDAKVNIHGHLHDVWDGFIDEKRWARDKELLGIDFKEQLRYPWQRLFALEYTNYRPVELNEFLAHPKKYRADGPNRIIQTIASDFGHALVRTYNKCRDCGHSHLLVSSNGDCGSLDAAGDICGCPKYIDPNLRRRNDE